MYSLQWLNECKRMIFRRGVENEREKHVRSIIFDQITRTRRNDERLVKIELTRMTLMGEIAVWYLSFVFIAWLEIVSLLFDRLSLSLSLFTQREQMPINLELSVLMLVKDRERERWHVWSVLALVHPPSLSRAPHTHSSRFSSQNKSLERVWKRTSAFDQRDELAVIQD